MQKKKKNQNRKQNKQTARVSSHAETSKQGKKNKIFNLDQVLVNCNSGYQWGSTPKTLFVVNLEVDNHEELDKGDYEKCLQSNYISPSKLELYRDVVTFPRC